MTPRRTFPVLREVHLSISPICERWTGRGTRPEKLTADPKPGSSRREQMSRISRLLLSPWMISSKPFYPVEPSLGGNRSGGSPVVSAPCRRQRPCSWSVRVARAASERSGAMLGGDEAGCSRCDAGRFQSAKFEDRQARDREWSSESKGERHGNWEPCGPAAGDEARDCSAAVSDHSRPSASLIAFE